MALSVNCDTIPIPMTNRIRKASPPDHASIDNVNLTEFFPKVPNMERSSESTETTVLAHDIFLREIITADFADAP